MVGWCRGLTGLVPSLSERGESVTYPRRNSPFFTTSRSDAQGERRERESKEKEKRKIDKEEGRKEKGRIHVNTVSDVVM